ncbi:FKBP-type peptidyl-prolyl cis-trans isomerase [Algibacter agarivorans]|uniref:FKBP-type peptidyl-prolyl cis-trans isomerase n=1 Tax=Algibacter agarivorans TaxID=1109741 RepID=A0ABP9GVF8_9FLAO
MRLRKVTLFILILTLGFISCKKDDNAAEDIVVVPPRDRGEQQIADKALLLDYLSKHYYNSSAFTDPNTISTQDLVITKLGDDETDAPDGHTLLSDPGVVETKIVDFADTPYEYYILRLNQGEGGDSPTFADNVDVLYEGFTLDNEVFDSRVNLEKAPFDLVSLIPGWRKVLPQFNTAQSFVENGDGTVDYINHGAGVMFLPSGLAYFSSSIAGIGAYEPIIFKFDLIRTTENDHDGDGIPSFQEDLPDENGVKDGEFIVNFEDLTDEYDDDTDGDGVPNYFDADDDGDGIPTINEDLNEDGDPTNDIGKNGMPNYLDPEETEFVIK